MAASSVTERLKKNIGSRVASSASGQKILLQIAGPEGQEIVENIKAAIEAKHGADVAKQRIDELFIMIVKARLMADSKKLTDENTAHLSEPFSKLGLLSVRILQPADARKDEPEDQLESEIVECISLAGQCASLLHACMMPHMQEKNQDTLKELLDFLSSEDFVRTLSQSPELATQRARVFTNLLELVELAGLRPEVHGWMGRQDRKGDLLMDKYSAVLESLQPFWRRTVMPASDKLKPLLVAHLTTHCPDVLAQFSTPPDSPETADALWGMVSSILESLYDLDWIKKKVEEGFNGLEKPLTADQYDILGEAWNASLKEGLGLRVYSRRFRKCFNIVFQLIVNSVLGRPMTQNVRPDRSG